MIDPETIKALTPTEGRILSPGYKYLGSLASNPGTYRSACWSLRTFLRLHLGAKAWADLISKQPPAPNGKPRAVDLREVFAVCAYGWQDLDRESFLGVRDALRGEGYADTVICKVLTAARGPVRRAAAMGLPVHDTEWLPGERPRVKSKRQGLWLSQDEVTQWLRACAWLELTARQPLYWTRVKACFALQLGAGLRSAEVLKLQIEDIDLRSRVLAIMDAKFGDGWAKFRAYKEGGLDFRPLVGYFSMWLDVRGTEPGQVICGISREPVPVPVPSRPLGYQSLEEAYREVSKVAGVRAFASHDLRRTFGTEVIQHVGLREAQVALRHKSANSGVYDMRDHFADDDDGYVQTRAPLQFPTVAEIFISVKADSFRVQYQRRSR